MLETVDALLEEDAPLPRHTEVEDMTLLLRGHIQLLIPEIEDRAAALPQGDTVRCLAMAGIGEARRKLLYDKGPGPGLVSAVAHAQRMARCCRALIFHFGEVEAEREAAAAAARPPRP